MKQILIPKWLLHGGVEQFSSDTHANPFGIVHLDNPAIFVDSEVTKDFAIMYRSGSKPQAPMSIDVDYNSVTVVKSEPTKVYRKQYSINLPAGEAEKTYTVNLIKRDSTKHDRNMYRISVTVKNDVSAQSLGNSIVAQWNRIKDSVNIEGLITVIVANVGGTYKLNVTVNPVYCNVQFTDGLSGLNVTESNGNQESLTLDEKELYRRIHECIGNRGVQYTYEFGETIYPFQERLTEGVDYIVYTLRFAVPRQASKTRDEVVYQLVHLIVDPSLTTIVNLIESIKSDSD